MRKFLKMLPLLVLMVLAKNVMGQGVFTSNASGNWSDASKWTLNSGSDIDGIPDSDDNVTIAASQTITVDVNSACNNLTLLTTSGTNLDLGAFTLEVSGTVNGANTSLTSTLITSTTGRIKFIGNSRALFGTNWAGVTTGLRFEVALTAGQTGTASTTVKAKEIIVTSGTFDLGTNELRPDDGNALGGTLTIGNGAILICARVSRIGTAGTAFGLFTINGTGKAVFSASSASFPTASQTFAFSSTSTIEYAGAAVTIVDRNYEGNLVFSGSGTKTWSPGANRTVGGNITITGTSVTLSFANGVNCTVSGNIEVGNSCVISPGSSANRFVASGANRTFTLLGTAQARVTSSNTQTPANNNAFEYQYSGFSSYVFSSTSWISLRNPTTSAVTFKFDKLSTNESYGNVEFAIVASGVKDIIIDFVGDISFAGNIAFPRVSGVTGTITVNFNARKIKIGGNIQLSGSNANVLSGSRTYNQGTSTVELNGSVAQNTLGGTDLPSTFYNLTLNNSSGVTVANAITVQNMLVLSGNATYTSLNNISGYTGLTYSASIAQITGAELPVSINNLTIDNPLGVSLGSSVSVNTNLLISNGSLITGANNLTLGASATATIGSTGTLSITGGTTDFASRPVTIQSGASSTGRIAAVTGDNIATGLLNATSVTQERYFAGGAATGTPPTPGVRGFRFIAHPFNSNPLLNTLVAGGLSITGNGGATNGFTNNPNPGATNSPSAFSYNPAATGAGTGSPDLGWTAYTNANTETWNKLQGIRVLFRGTNTQGLDGNNVYAVNPLTLSLTGAVNTGAQNFALPATTNVTDPKWSLVGNPYPSQIDVQTLLRSKYNTPTPAAGNIGAAAYVFNPTKSGTLRGGYDMIDISAAGSYILPTCGVVLVQNTIATTHNIPFAETDKSTGTPTLNFRTTSTNNALVLTMKDANGVELDNTYIRLNNNAANTFENRDGGKMLNDYSIYTLTPDNTLLAIDSRPEPIVESIIPMGVKSATAQSFVLKATELALPIRIEAYLKDKFLNVATPLSLGTEYSFSVDPSNAATLGNNRFEIVMRNNNALPATFLNVTAAQKNAGIEVSWTTANETNMSNYEVEESTDGNNFSKATSVAANNTTTNIYNWLDASIINGDNYYRIKAIEKNGTAKYSNVVKVKIGGKGAGFTVYPNPVKGGVVSLQMSNVEKGIYTVKIFNNIGQELAAKAINHNGGSATQTIDLGKGIASGTYNMQITNGTKTVITKTVIVE